MVCPICLRRLGSLGFIEMLAIMSGVGVAPLMIVTNNVILHTTEMKDQGIKERPEMEQQFLRSCTGDAFALFLGVPECVGRLPWVRGF